MRKDGGGLICTAVHPRAASRLGLPFASEVFGQCLSGVSPSIQGVTERLGDIPYDPKNRSSFSLWVNHRRTFTGITDNDRSLTITEIADQVRKSLNGGGQDFKSQFRTPGHVAILRAADDLLSQRQGQTELSVALADAAGVVPAIAICEMLDDESGLALTREDAERYARRNGLVFVEGAEVLEHWSAP
jgi:3,4-dihydroxy 2-butanone 4-phosphate synthase